MPTRTTKERVRRLVLATVACALAAALALAAAGAAFAAGSAGGTHLGLRVTDSSKNQGSGEGGQPGSTQLGIRVTDSANPAPLTVTVTFDSHGGSSVAGQTIPYNTPAARPADPVREGYDFKGWFTEATGGSVHDFTASVTGDLTLHAQWSATYVIAFDGNGADGGAPMDPMEMVVGREKALTPNAFSRTGYTFKEWNTEADGTGDRYADGAEVDFADALPGDTVRLYARWTLQVVCSVPDAATLTVDASGELAGEDQKFSSASVAPLEVSAVKSSRLAGAESVFADQSTLDGVRVVLTPTEGSGSIVQVPLATGDNGQPAGFIVPANGKLSVMFGLKLPVGARLSFLESAAQVAQLTYVIAPAS